jgi:hypothetical protein
MIIDASTNEGKLRLRLSDWSDIPLIPSSVYQQTLLDNDNNLQRCTTIIGSYILGILSQKTHRKLANLEVWGKESFDSYLKYLDLIIKDPAYSGVSPIPYMAQGSGTNDIVDFVDDWKRNYYNGTESQELAIDAERSPNDGSRFGFGGLV